MNKSLIHLSESWRDKECPYESELTRKIFEEITSRPLKIDDLICLDCFSKYLWPNLNEKCSDEHYLCVSILISRNWCRVEQYLTSDTSKTELLFNHLLRLALNEQSSHSTIAICIQFISTLFSNLQNHFVRKLVGPLVSIGVWHNINQGLRDEILKSNEALIKPWNSSNKKLEKDESGDLIYKRDWIFNLSQRVFNEQSGEIGLNDGRSEDLDLIYADFVLKCLSQLPTRRYLLTVFRNLNILARLTIRKSSHGLGDKWIEILRSYMNFPCDEFTGESLNEKSSWELYTRKMYRLQNLANSDKYKEKLHILALSHFDSVYNDIEEHLSPLSDEELDSFAKELHIIGESYPRKVVLQCFKEWCYWSSYHSLSHIDLNETTSSLIESVRDSNIPSSIVPVCRLGNQYISSQDYWSRHYSLHSLKFLVSIRSRIEYAISERINNLIEITTLTLIKTALPSVGEDTPAYVRAEAQVKASWNWEHMDRQSKSYALLGLNIQNNKLTRVVSCSLVGASNTKNHRALMPTDVDSDSEDDEKDLRLRNRKFILDFKTEDIQDINHIIRIEGSEWNLLGAIQKTYGSGEFLPSWFIDQFLGFGGIDLTEFENENPVLYTGEMPISKEQMKSSFGYEIDADGPYNFSLNSEGDVVSVEPHKSENYQGINKQVFDDEELKALFHSLEPGLTIFDISRGSFMTKMPLLAQVVHLLIENSESKTLIISKSENSLQQLATHLEEIPIQLSSFLILGESTIDELLETQGALLTIVKSIAMNLNVHGSFYDSSAAGSFYDEHIAPILAKPESDLFKKLNSQHFVENYKYSLTEVFSSIARLFPLDILSHNDVPEWLVTGSLAKAIGVTSKAFLTNFDLYKNSRFENLIILESDEISEVETALALRIQVKRMIMIGDVDHVKRNEISLNSQTLDNFHLDRTLLSRIVSLGFDKVYHLTDLSLYRPELRQGGTCEDPVSNPGFLFTKQFIALDEGEEEQTDNNDFTNSVEARYIVRLYQYMRLLGYPKDKISLTSPSISQCKKIKTRLKKWCDDNIMNSEVFGIPNVCSMDSVPDSSYVLVSLVRSSTVTTKKPLPQALLGLYLIGNSASFYSDETWNEGNLRVIPGELYGKPALKRRNGVSIEGYDHLDQYVREMSQQRYNYEMTKKKFSSNYGADG